MSLQSVKDTLAVAMFGITASQAVDQLICIQCKRPIVDIGFPTLQDSAEYLISGICHKCYPSTEGEE
jgi:hypothetical protein